MSGKPEAGIPKAGITVKDIVCLDVWMIAEEKEGTNELHLPIHIPLEVHYMGTWGLAGSCKTKRTESGDDIQAALSLRPGMISRCSLH